MQEKATKGTKEFLMYALVVKFYLLWLEGKKIVI